ncbi:LacI family transcriptional regulator [Paenalcaligenes niemegkensis]|uniref:LacI family DNA-binding transcriptional regulator n=1 Tax=Paenalcaligenes niemegkensis TaxID=2895469 RepID=UPI001EE97262|nr:LacI family DNA-binding transcriptional regulator [Paenalcaligenes niemegkensis]MCQ9616167.1 LacI family transcriptional regulator [Paenalcaligenes niemegkensis]
MSTIQKVAKEAGVSVATVSRTFNLPDKVNAETRKIVEQAAARLRYIPNASARSLRTQRSQTLGVVLPTLNNPVFAECLQGIAQAAAAAGYSIMPFTTDYLLKQEESAVRALHGFGVDGLILVVSDPRASATLDFVREQNIPYVLAYNSNDEHPCISVDNPAAFARMVAYLVSLGHQRIAMVSGRRSDSDRAQQRYSGFLAGMTAAGLQPHQAIIEVPFIDNAVDQIVQALQHKPRPSALVCSNDLLAIRAIRAAHQLGLRVPDDISITGFDGIRLGQDLTPSLTTISQPNADIGRYSVSLLIQCLSQGSKPGPSASLLLNYVLCPAESSAPPSQVLGG